jgi:outer membrane protein
MCKRLPTSPLSLLILLIGFLVGGMHGTLRAQTALTLEQCLQLAVENNIQVKVSQNNVTGAEVNYMQRKFDFLPTVAANIPLNKTFGNTADIYTQAIAESPWTSNPGIGASLVAFRGLSKWNELKNAQYTLSANQYGLEDFKNDIRLNTALAFFQVMFAADNLDISKARLELLEKQVRTMKAQVDAGTKTQGDMLVMESQLTTEQLNAVTQQNNYDKSLLSLILTLNLDPAGNYTIARPDFLEAKVDSLEALPAIFQAARLSNPAIRQQEFRALAAKYAINTARSAYYPTLNVSFGLGTFFSSNAKVIDGYGIVDGIPTVIYGPRIPIDQQLTDNFNQYLTLALNIPIFNRMQTRQNYLLSKLNHQTAQLNLEAEELELYKAIQQAHLDAKASDAKYAATQAQQKSLQESLRYAQARYDAGMLDFLAYLEVLNNSTRAEIEQVQAQYDRILKRKILDLYQGKPLQF